jgi:hypothetical protein
VAIYAVLDKAKEMRLLLACSTAHDLPESRLRANGAEPPMAARCRAAAVETAVVLASCCGSSIMGNTFAEEALLGRPAELCQLPRQVAHG